MNLHGLFRNKKFKLPFIAVSVIVTLTIVLLIPLLFKKEQNSINQESIDWQKKFGLHLPDGLTFAGDSLPLHDSTFLFQLSQYLPKKSGAKKNLALMIKRSGQWFPLIESILKEKGLPEDLKYIAVAESHLSNAKSPRNAAGFWQLMATTAQSYGLEITEDVDERLSVEKATRAACAYLSDAHEKLNNWLLAAAGYNLGLNGIAKQLQVQNKKSYFELALNPETRSYVYKLIALKCVFENPDWYEIINLQPLNNKIPVVIIKTDSSIQDLSFFAKQKNMEYDIFKELNPWLISGKLTNVNRKIYQFQYPVQAYIEKYKANYLKKDAIQTDSSDTNRPNL